MKIKLVILAVLATFVFSASVEKHMTRSGKIEIFSETPMFTIEATNHKVGSIINTKTGDVVASTLVRSFKFREALVEEHFNENYMESAKYPKATFKGRISNNSDVNYDKDGIYNIFIEGKLSIHGTTNPIKEKGTITIKDGKISAKTDFMVSLKGYGIKVEKAYTDAIKDEIELKVTLDFTPIKK